jgi:hypothetical protein
MGSLTHELHSHPTKLNHIARAKGAGFVVDRGAVDDGEALGSDQSFVSGIGGEPSTIFFNRLLCTLPLICFHDGFA